MYICIYCCLISSAAFEQIRATWSRRSRFAAIPAINHRDCLIYTLKGSWRKGERNGSRLGRSVPTGHPYRGAIFLRHPL